MSVTIGDLLRSVSKHHEEDRTYQLYTKWGQALKELSHEEKAKGVLTEYPRPYMERESYCSLNGYWKYAFEKGTSLPESDEKEHSWMGEILVPFSPESVLSEVNRVLQPDETLWYACKLPEAFLSKKAEGQRLLLHFGAVDFACCVYVNGRKCVCREYKRGFYDGTYTHSGGYTPFTVDVTDYLKEHDNRVTIAVLDASDTSFHNRGKQTLKRGGMFYTAQSGMWQSVWLEWVPKLYIESLYITPDLEQKTAVINVTLNDICKAEDVKVKFSCENKVCTYQFPCGKSTIKFVYHVDKLQLWSPENPFLYDCKVRLESAAAKDEVKSIFGMRSFTIEKDEQGIPRFYLNHEPYFLNGLLDQGYWPDGLYTAPSEEALLYDIETMKKCGYNMMRKHIKVECQRWYYLCDKLGMVVWQDMINGGEPQNMVLVCYLPTALPQICNKISDHLYGPFHRTSEAGRKEWYQEAKETIEALRPAVSLSAWVPFNEGWGQFDSVEATEFVRSLDDTRLIDSVSGWFDRGAGDFLSEHNYFHKLKARRDKKNRAFVLSEYGGYAHHVPGHSYTDRIYGYKKFDTVEAYQKAVDALNEEIQALIPQGLCGAVYTQVSDVEEEVNGILTYDRKVCKLPIE